MTLQLADWSIKHPQGIAEDVLVKVGKFYFPVDFVVLEMEEDVEIPLILGRPFLATGGALVDVQEGKLTLRVWSEVEIFDVFKSTEKYSQAETCMKIDTVKTQEVEILKEHKLKPPTESGSKIKVENKVTEPPKVEEKRKPDKRGRRMKEGCLIDETKEANGFWVRMFYASHMVKERGACDEPNTTVPPQEPD